MKRLLIAAGALLLSTSALADECGNASTQLELNTCTDRNTRRQTRSSTRLTRPP
jgi:uncharacterized protein